MDIQALLNAGFTHKELYDKGILVVAEQPQPVPIEQPQPTPIEQPQPAPIEQPQPTPIEQPQPTQINDVLTAINTLSTDIKTMVQAINRNNAERSQQPQQMTLDEAIYGLYIGK